MGVSVGAGADNGRAVDVGGVEASLAARIAPEVTAFAREVGDCDPVTVVGARTHWAVGGTADVAAREVRAPAGVWEYEPSEMTVRCGAGTPVSELAAHLAPSGQMVPLDPASRAATVGGVLACGFSGHRRLRYGHVRDLVLQTRHVDASGKVVTAGGPTVKNVSGYDLPRLLVGSLGTLGFLAEVILRTLPIPAASQWLSGDGDPFAAFDLLYRPSSILWNGTQTWVLLEGDPSDVAVEAAVLEAVGFEPCNGPPSLPCVGRESCTPSGVRELAGTPGDWVAEIGVGLVHRAEPVQPAEVHPTNVNLMSQLKDRLDPHHRLNPGRRAW